MAGQFCQGITIQKLPENCIVNAITPVFAGIDSLDAQLNGSLRASWLAGTTSGKDPIRYEVYIKEGASLVAGDFIAANRIPISPGVLSVDIFTLADQTTLLVYGKTYAVGVRAVDAMGYESGNLQFLTEVSNGVLPDYMNAIANSLSAAASSIAGGAGQQMSLQVNETTMSIDADGVI